MSSRLRVCECICACVFACVCVRGKMYMCVCAYVCVGVMSHIYELAHSKRASAPDVYSPVGLCVCVRVRLRVRVCIRDNRRICVFECVCVCRSHVTHIQVSQQELCLGRVCMFVACLFTCVCVHTCVYACVRGNMRMCVSLSVCFVC